MLYAGVFKRKIGTLALLIVGQFSYNTVSECLQNLWTLFAGAQPMPPWLVANEETLRKIIAAIIVVLLVVWGFWPQSLRWKINSVDKILRKIPKNQIPESRDWSSAMQKINETLCRKLVGREVLLRLIVRQVRTTERGRYTRVPCVWAHLSSDTRTSLPISFLAYFDKAIPDMVGRVLAHAEHDAISIHGIIRRADITDRRSSGEGFIFNVDVNDCELTV
jgi:hypothetical protein